jgi:hypothetical protein
MSANDPSATFCPASGVHTPGMKSLNIQCRNSLVLHRTRGPPAVTLYAKKGQSDVVGLELLDHAPLLLRSTVHDRDLRDFCVILMWMMGGHRRGGSTALDILNERFARGEISRTEYEERRRALRS